MGTELHHALNLHETLQKKKCSALRYNIGASLCRPCSCKTDIEEQASISWYQPPGFMERFEEKFDHRAMRQTMLKQDEIFREQVGELHRLYQVQKKLMAELTSNELRSLAPISRYPSSYTTQLGHIHANQDNQHIFWSTSMTQSSHPAVVSHFSDRNLEQPSGSSHRGIFDLEQQTTNADSSTCLRNVMVENEHELLLGQCEKDVDTNLELTLTVGQASNSNKGKEKRTSTSTSDGEGDSSDVNNPSSSQESSKKTNWLLRALSLK